MRHRFSRLAAVLTLLAMGLSPTARVVAADTLPVVSIRASDRTASEPGTNPGAFTVTRTGDTRTSLTVGYTVSGTATTGVDYTALSGSVVIPAGARTATILVTPLDDLTIERPETVVVALATSLPYTIGTPSAAIIRVQDNDGRERRETEDERPGWGRGDDNHEHFGPPGLGCRATDSCKDDDDDRVLSAVGSRHQDKDDAPSAHGRGREQSRGRR
ncbi:MAG: hypothetical protein EXR58_08330 [Chloroflexi bacterium]|nr:hypothetical protein [Chloroflexota bacterium]